MPALRLTESKRRTVTQDDDEQQEARREAGNVFKLLELLGGVKKILEVYSVLKM